jgi:tetratricopeptide (TPR) repeat protein
MTDIHSQADYIEIPDDLLARKPHLAHLANDLSRVYADRGKLVTDAVLQKMGEALWQGEVSPPENKIRPVVIASDVMDIQALPWECAYHPEHEFLARHLGFTFSRCLPSIQTETPLRKGPLRVLLFSSLPDNVNRLDVEEEQAQVLHTLNPLIQQGLVALEMPDDGRFETLTSELQKNQYHLVFLSGHGQYYWEDNYGVFCFEDAHGQMVAVKDTELAKAFIGRGVQCVVLSACESAKATTGLAQCLVKQGLTHVVGMRESILDKAGIVFAKTFCGAIGQRERVDVAVQNARRAILTEVKETVTLKDARKSGSVELSQSQWCLPLLFSQNLAQPLIDWEFTQQPPSKKHAIANIWENIPDFETGLFIGRRSELRELRERFINGSQHQLLITGPGGQGKTALATRLAQRLEAKGYQVITYVAKPENRWETFIFNLIIKVLDKAHRAEFKEMKEFCSTPQEEAQALLNILLQQTQGKILFFFDNLESVQDDKSRVLQHTMLIMWLAEITRLESQGTKLLLTSRYNLPDFPEEKHHPLKPATILDFTYYIQRQQLVITGSLQRLYRDLNGNFRGVKFFLKAQEQQPDFRKNLQEAQQALYVDMAIETLFKLLPEPEQKLLTRLPAYQSPVPMAGIERLQPAAKIQLMLDYALLETQLDFDVEETVYQVSPLVQDWLAKQFAVTKEDYTLAAQYQHKWFLQEEKQTISQAINVHKAWQLAEEKTKARRFALDKIVPYFDNAGLYRTLLNDWFPDILKDEDKQLKGDALNRKGKIHHHLGDYDTALEYLQQSLLIRREIGDKQVEGTTLNNISQVFKARGDYDTALEYLQQSLLIMREIGDKKGEGTTLNNISQIYDARGDYDTALEYLQQSLLITREIGDKQVEGATLNNISQIYDARGDYDTALEYLQQSLLIRREIGDKQGEGTTLNNISTIYQARGDYDTALEYLQQSLLIRREIGDKQGESVTLNNIGQIHKARGNYDAALEYSLQDLEIVREIGDKKGEGTTLNNISGIYRARGDYDTALEYLQQSLLIRREIGDTSGLCTTLFNIAHIHLAKKENEQAIAKFVQAYQIATKIGYHQVLQALENLANGWEQDGLNFWQQLSESE